MWLKVGTGCEADHSNVISIKKLKVKQQPKQQKPGGQKKTLTKERKEDEEILCGFVKRKVLILKCEPPAGHQIGSERSDRFEVLRNTGGMEGPA